MCRAFVLDHDGHGAGVAVFQIKFEILRAGCGLPKDPMHLETIFSCPRFGCDRDTLFLSKVSMVLRSYSPIQGLGGGVMRSRYGSLGLPVDVLFPAWPDGWNTEGKPALRVPGIQYLVVSYPL